MWYQSFGAHHEFPKSLQTSETLSQNTSQSMIQSFSSPVALKLDEENNLPWKQQVEATIENMIC